MVCSLLFPTYFQGIISHISTALLSVGLSGAVASEVRKTGSGKCASPSRTMTASKLTKKLRYSEYFTSNMKKVWRMRIRLC